jgi:hypothetical protein
VRPDDYRNRPGVESQAARRAGVLLDRDGTFLLDCGEDAGLAASIGAYGIHLRDRIPEEPGCVAPDPTSPPLSVHPGEKYQ